MQAYRTLVVLQPTPFCNIDCKYCYLPFRSSTKHMPRAILERIFSQVLSSKIVQDPIVFLWHLGEPLAVPIDFYQEAFSIAQNSNSNERAYSHCFQTNATLINDDWVSLIKKHNVRLGLSLDGPDFIHDQQRVDRKKRGTHAKVMASIKILQQAEVAFSVIMVLTANSLNYPDEICNFFLENNIADIGFNIDEVEGINKVTSFLNSDVVKRYKQFFSRVLQRSYESKGKLRIREAWTNLRILTGKESAPFNTTNQPFRILNFDCDGNFSTFCPELVSAKSSTYNDFIMGNIATDSLDNIVGNPIFQKVNTEVQKGLSICKESCNYWNFCGGGSPSNKFFEHGRFDVAETLTCRIHKKATIDVLINYLDDLLAS